MRIGIDLTALLPKPTGVDRYLMGMVRSLASTDRQNEYVLFINGEDRSRFQNREPSGGGSGRLPANFRLVSLSRRPRAARLLFQQFVLPAASRALALDVLHSPTFIMPMWRGRLGHVLTIHDMTSFLLPEYHPSSRRGRMYELAVGASIKRAHAVSVPSQAVKQDIGRLLPDVPETRVRVIPAGVDEHFRPQTRDEVEPVLDRLRLTAPYILYVGTVDPRKNLALLVDAYDQLVSAHGIVEHLVIAGQPGWSVADLSSRASSTSAPHLRGRIHTLGYVPEGDLPGLYAGARVFAYPSLSEGFGFPPLEAMATGVPVVASDTSALRDNLAGAAALVAPGDAGALAAAIRRLLTDEAARGQQIEAGLRRAADFSWNSFGRQTRACYEDVYAMTR